MDKVRWGVLGVSMFAVRKMIPAMKRGADTEVLGIASRSQARADEAARELGIPRAYGSYEALLGDPDIEAVYIPLPNHLHVPWSVRAAHAGKHVLCEKPIALDAREAATLIEVRDRTGVLVQEAAMVRVHPRWLAVRRLLDEGAIGALRAFQSTFSWYCAWPENVRFRPEMGGGALLDVGFYPVTMSRFCFRDEPTRVLGLIERDRAGGIDGLTSAILEYPRGQAVFTCSMLIAAAQHATLIGTDGRIEIDTPWTAPPDAPTGITLASGRELPMQQSRTLTLEAANAYTLEADLFSRAIRDRTPAPLPLEDAVKNMAVLDAIARSAASGTWEAVAS